MFFAIPLANKPTWHAPPWMTVLIIVINMLVYWGWQAPEERAVERSAELYASSGLAEMEVPHYIQHLEQRAQQAPDEKTHLETVQALWKERELALVYQDMWHEQLFRKALLAGQVIRENDPQHAEWQSRRSLLAPHEPQAFTTRWAQYFDRGFTDRPETLLTATFLHGSVGHLLGNMVFLFLFGFTLEMALGSRLYLLLYLLCGVGASAVSLWSHTGTATYGLGASGAIAGLMAMYVVMYKLRRIKFFYMLFFYFNYAKWPALIMLPVYMAHELLQQWLGGQGVDYMAHFGGLVSGALLMGLLMSVKKLDAPANLIPAAAAPLSGKEARVQASIQRAERLSDELDYAAANQAWHSAAMLRPRDPKVLEPWFEVAQHFPASDEFHTAAKLLLTLPDTDHAARKRTHAHFHTYLKLAKPGLRLSANTLVHLIPVFVKLHAWDDAQRLARLLHGSSSVHPKWPDTLTLLVNGLTQNNQWEAAMAWLPALQTHAPTAPVTRLLEKK